VRLVTPLLCSAPVPLQINRSITLKNLKKLAEADENDTQYIFITPTDLSAITPNPKCKITRMRAPERGQLTIAFQHL
jgi:hypothetical protein